MLDDALHVRQLEGFTHVQEFEEEDNAEDDRVEDAFWEDIAQGGTGEEGDERCNKSKPLPVAEIGTIIPG